MIIALVLALIVGLEASQQIPPPKPKLLTEFPLIMLLLIVGFELRQ